MLRLIIRSMQRLKATLRGRAARRAVMVGAVIVFILAAASLIIGVYVFAKIHSNIDTSSLPANAQQAISEATSTTYQAFQLLPISLIVLSAAVILGILIRFSGGEGGE